MQSVLQFDQVEGRSTHCLVSGYVVEIREKTVGHGSIQIPKMESERPHDLATICILVKKAGNLSGLMLHLVRVTCKAKVLLFFKEDLKKLEAAGQLCPSTPSTTKEENGEQL
jgi:hypothetical protein